jgi:tetratricopeptide (TPR) repeat protein
MTSRRNPRHTSMQHLQRSLAATYSLAAVLLLGAAPASAQDLPAPAARALTPDERARELYLRGDRLYAEGNYVEAVVAFERAYELSRRPALLYDMANALERLGRYEEALRRLEQYIPHAPEHQRNSVLKRMASLQARAEEQHRRERGDAQAPASPVLQANESAASSAPGDRPEREVPWLGYAIGGAGVAGIGLGVVFGLSAAGARSDAEDLCVEDGDGTLCPSSARVFIDRGESRALLADIAFGLGIAAVGVGVYLVLSSDSESGSTTQLRATTTSEGGKLNLVTSF